MCTKTSNCGFIFQDAYSQSLASYRDLLLRLANLSRVLYLVHMLRFRSVHNPSDPSFSVHPSAISSGFVLTPPHVHASHPRSVGCGTNNT